MSTQSPVQDKKATEVTISPSIGKKQSSQLRIHSDSSNDELLDNIAVGTSVPIRDIHALAKYSDEDITEYDTNLKESKFHSFFS